MLRNSASSFHWLSSSIFSCLSVPHCDISSYLAQIKKIEKNKVHLFFNFGSGWPPNWSPSHSTGPQTPFLTDISVTVAQIKTFKKQSAFVFLISVLLIFNIAICKITMAMTPATQRAPSRQSHPQRNRHELPLIRYQLSPS